MDRWGREVKGCPAGWWAGKDAPGSVGYAVVPRSPWTIVVPVALALRPVVFLPTLQGGVPLQSMDKSTVHRPLDVIPQIRAQSIDYYI